MSSRGEFISVWREAWEEIWNKICYGLPDQQEQERQLFDALLRDGFVPPVAPDRQEYDENGEGLSEYTEASDEYDIKRKMYEEKNQIAIADGTAVLSSDDTKAKFRKYFLDLISYESEAVRFLEKAHVVVSNFGGGRHEVRYVNNVKRFTVKYNLFYEIHPPFKLYPTLPGFYARLIDELKTAAHQDKVSRSCLGEFEQSLKKLQHQDDTRDQDAMRGQIKDCLMKQFILMEALAKAATGKKKSKVACPTIEECPGALKAAVANIYGFRGNCLAHPSDADIKMRDLIAVSILLMGLSPYLTKKIKPENIYRDFKK